MAKKAKKKNPQDATLRNIRALKKEIARLNRRIKGLVEKIKQRALVKYPGLR